MARTRIITLELTRDEERYLAFLFSGATRESQTSPARFMLGEKIRAAIAGADVAETEELGEAGA